MASEILVPVDFHAASLEALSLARQLGQKLDLEVVLLHVFTVPVIVYPGFDPIVTPGLPEEVSRAAGSALDDLAAKHGHLRTVLRAGDPAHEILGVIGESRPAFVVMGTRGRRGLAHLLLGSVAEHVVRASTAPVITVHAPPSVKTEESTVRDSAL